MKQLLLLLVISIAITGYGQKEKKDSSEAIGPIGRFIDSTNYSLTLVTGLTLGGSPALITVDTNVLVRKYSYDTSRVIMLVCDTAKGGKIIAGDGSMAYFSNTMLRWQFGYEVTKDYSGGWIMSSTDLHVKWLGEDKKPLPENIIVWQSKTLK